MKLQENNIIFIHLYGEFEILKERIEKRKNSNNSISSQNSHFFNPNLLKSQFDTLERPKDDEGISFFEVDVGVLDPENIISKILEILKNKI